MELLNQVIGRCAFRFKVAALLGMQGIGKLVGCGCESQIYQKQLQHYASGHSKPRKAQRKKIEEGLHKLGHWCCVKK